MLVRNYIVERKLVSVSSRRKLHMDSMCNPGNTCKVKRAAIQVAECLPSRWKALSSNPRATKKNHKA
jgi:hypothetical protein